MTHDEDRINYLAAEGGASLPDPERAELPPLRALPATERAELDRLRALLAAPSTWAEPDPGLEDRVVAAITQGAGARPRRQPVRRPARRLRLTLRWPAYSLAAAAAAAVIAAVVILLGSGAGGPARERFAMVVSGTHLAPEAHGSATLTKTGSGWQIVLAATGLPHLDKGRYYEAWLKNAAGILVPVGTFNDARSVTLWSGVPVTEFQTLTVTRQVANGNPASSGQRVLTGRISAHR